MTHTRTIDVDERAAFWAQQNRRALSVRDKYDLDDVDDEIEAIADTYLRVKADHDNYKAALSHMERERDALTARRDELLATIARISQTVPLESEVAEALNQRGAMLAEIGTLKARVVELEGQRDEALAKKRGATEANNKLAATIATLREERDRALLYMASDDVSASLKKLADERDEARRRVMPGEERRKLEGDIMDAERDTAERIAAWLESPCPCGESDCESKYRAIAESVRAGAWRKP